MSPASASCDAVGHHEAALLEWGFMESSRASVARERVRIDQRISLALSYPVIFTEGMFECENQVLAEVLTDPGVAAPSKVVAVVDDGVHRGDGELLARIEAYFSHHAARLALACPPLVVPGGETAKNDSQVVERVLETLFARRLDRHSYLLVVGGGAVLDAVGYAAALFHRGMRLVRAPTTVLAQDDAGVGVKNGINAYGVKNALGTFAPPHAVINDHGLLASLSQRDHVAGIAEAIKVALIRDPDFFAWIEEHAEALRERAVAPTREVIHRCAALHLAHIAGAGDPFESGSARPLDFGHWSAHKLEVLSGHQLRHGEAVAIGMAIDTRYAELTSAIEPEAAARVLETIQRVGLPLWHPTAELTGADGAPLVLDGLEEFREHLGGRLTVTMLAGIGRGREVHEIDRALMIRAILQGKH